MSLRAMADVSIVVADATRLAAIRDGLQLPGRMMHFSSGSLGSAVESIRAYRPKVVAVDALFVQTTAGASFVERLDAMSLAGVAIRLVVEQNGRWIATSRQESAIAIAKPRLVTASPAGARTPATVASLSSALAAAAQAVAPNTRRAPRFLVRDPVEAVIESGRASVVDMSVLGAQLVSLPVLRPNQKIKLALPDSDDMLNLAAQVAWSLFEQAPSEPEPHYRVGIEFTDAAQRTLEQYRRRHCADQPIPLRGR
jgi:PilZ domain-containing protein